MCDGLLGVRKPPKWLSNLAWSIHRLFARDNNVARVRELVRGWGDESYRQSVKGLDFDRRREKHESAIRADKQLRSRKAGPPKRGHKWEKFSRVKHRTKRSWRMVEGKRKYSTKKYVETWRAVLTSLRSCCCPTIR